MACRWFPIGCVVLFVLSVGFSTARAAEDKEQDEQKVSIKDVPKAVRKTLKREAFGEKIKTVDKEKLNGKTVYEADVEIDGRNYEIVVDEKGVLIHKKLDEEENEKAQAGERKSSKSKADKKDNDDEEDEGNGKNSEKHEKEHGKP